jgi:predicted deacetylase
LSANPAAPRSRRTLAVTLHDVEPATFERCALMRDWLDDLGVARVTLLVIPAADLHPLGDRAPGLADWLAERARCGDEIAQHGFQHVQVHAAPPVRQLVARAQGAGAAEFVGLGPVDTRRVIDAGRRILRLAGLEPRGFVAPAYAYTPALREVLRERFAWWAGLLGLHAGESSRLSPAVGLGTSGPVKRATSPGLLRLGAALSGSTLRLDLHPADLDHPRHVVALERVLRGARKRSAVTLEQLACPRR